MQDNGIRHIVIVDPGVVIEQAGMYYLPERSYLGYKKYKQYLDGYHQDFTFSVVALGGVQVAGESGDVASLFPFTSDQIGLKKYPARKYLEALDKSAVVLVLYKQETADFVNLGHKVVYLVENPPSVRKAIYAIEAAGKISYISRIRVNIGLWRQELAARRVFRRAVGLQCNGEAASATYGKYSNNSLTFYDHRVESVHDDSHQTKSPLNKFSVGFSGRIVPIKGSQYMAELSHELYRLDPSITFYVMGDGTDRQKVLDKAAPNLVYKGFMGYSSEWEPFVQKNIDLMVFPHPQGDPSMTYYEALGQGLPVVAFANETSDFLQSQGLAWTVPSGDVKELARRINELAHNPGEVKAKARAARDFMRKNLYHDTVARRMEHLVSVARTSYGAERLR